MLPQAALYDELGFELEQLLNELSRKLGISRMSELEQVWEITSRVCEKHEANLAGALPPHTRPVQPAGIARQELLNA